MKIKTWIKYYEGYLPTPRCRKLRYRECEDYIDAELLETSQDKLELAFNVNNTDIYAHVGKLWRAATERDIHYPNENNPMTALEALIYAHVTYSTYFPRYRYDGKDEEREDVIARVKDDMQRYLLVNGVLYCQTAEPMYNITTFGLGHNHGGTGLFVDYHYNPNLSWKSYFNALDYDKAMQTAIQVASGRGDTISAARFEEMYKNNERLIVVYNDEYVTHNPATEHGDGDEFLNDLEKIISSSDSETEAGLLCCLATLSKTKK